MLHLPEQFPFDAVTVIGAIIKSKQVTDKVEAMEALLTLVGYGAFVSFGHTHSVGAFPVNPEWQSVDLESKPSEEEAEQALQALAPQEEGNVGAFNPQGFLKNAIKVLKFVLPLILAA
jgi:hypothetical protein